MHAFESLTPDVVLDALASVGLFGDGRHLPETFLHRSCFAST